jgi:gamma-glutamylcyclotransferase (GGCT)/AIG2-like uncharacterized protein YtfP
MGNKRKKITQKEMIDQTNALKHIESLLQNSNGSGAELKSSYKKPKETKIISPFDSIKMSTHANSRANQRFNLSKTEALECFRDTLKKARYLGVVSDKYGSEGKLYTINKIAIITTLDLAEIKTVYRREDVTIKYEPIRKKMCEFHDKELRKLNRRESSMVKKLELLKLETQVEIAQLNLRLHKTRSQAVKNVCKARANAINERIHEIESEINQIRKDRNTITKSIIAVI